MVRMFEIKCSCSPEQLMQDLLEILAVEFEPLREGWCAHTFGGTRLDLNPIGPGRYSLKIEDNPDHPLHHKEERSFGKLADVDRWLPEALMKAGIACTRLQ